MPVSFKRYRLADEPYFAHLAAVNASINYLPSLAAPVIPDLAYLRVLRLDNNAIDSMQPLDGRFPLLETLSLAGNAIPRITGLASAVSLTSLDLTANELTVLDSLKGCTALKTLKVAGNAITDAQHVVFLPSLTSLDVADNQLADLGATASALRGCASLVELSAGGNPLAATASYKAVCLESAALERLDGHVVTPLFRERMSNVAAESRLSDLVADTTDAYLQRIEEARETKASKLRLLKARTLEIESHFDAYQTHLESEMHSLTRYVHDVLASGGRTDVDLDEMRAVLAVTEAARWKEVLGMLQNDADAWEAEVARAKAATSHTDKLRTLAKDDPRAWRELKERERELVAREDAIAAREHAAAESAQTSAAAAAERRRAQAEFSAARGSAFQVHRTLDAAHRPHHAALGADRTRTIAPPTHSGPPDEAAVEAAAASRIQGQWRASRASHDLIDRASPSRRSSSRRASSSRRSSSSRTSSRTSSRRLSRTSSRGARSTGPGPPPAIAGSVQSARLLHAARQRDALAVRKVIGELSNSSEVPSIINQHTDTGWTALHHAAYNNDVESIALLLEAGAQLEARDRIGATPLYVACLSGHTEAAAVLVDANAEIDTRKDEGWTPLLAACHYGFAAVVGLLLEAGANPDAQTPLGSTPTFLAAQENHIVVLSLLVGVGASVNLLNNDGVSPLVVAASKGHSQVVVLLLDGGADPNVGHKNGWSALLLAAHKGHLSIVQDLVACGADVDACNSSGASALYVATQNGAADIVAAIITAGADPNIPKSDGWYPLLIAAHKGAAQVTEELLSHPDIDVHVTNTAAATSLYLAAQSGSIEVVRMLLAAGANPNSAKDDGWTPLMIAVHRRHLKVARVLIGSGAEVNQRNANGATALYVAAQLGFLAAVNLLLEAQASPLAAKAVDGWTALHVATTGGFEDVVAALLAAGANPHAAAHDGETPLHIAAISPSPAMQRLFLTYTTVPELPHSAPLPTRSRSRSKAKAKSKAKSRPKSKSKLRSKSRSKSKTKTKAKARMSGSPSSGSRERHDFASLSSSEVSFDEAGSLVSPQQVRSGSSSPLGAPPPPSSSTPESRGERYSLQPPPVPDFLPGSSPGAYATSQPTTKSWECVNCTFVNAYVSSCEVCGTPQGGGLIPSDILQQNKALVSAPPSHSRSRGGARARAADASSSADDACSQASDDDGNTCLVCWDGPKTAAFVHGDTGHLSACMMCAQQVLRRKDVCPVCREPIERVVEIFKV
ncbi:uncharacterized protein AMSG_11713 [Thecamonas trahens ATCC 50062]|uniref:RING-type domain-containing protein n=1 Tax=Thecamonas trahens ATCC 50062 TaxID=461836 RepID=A0A0L0D5Z8_THETB|nr:hypothetical protein AMSG_11713 [Thecamonas trahens ATCC 50062]KNC47506.1 hypothetical protein AMSG_11713 [Thecamonas trahens ATCC 50062]|eukprot:XP_013759557.1 hypothetical protein AMSG_11713 [Thecamonas trahens ATCC 50062]